MSRPRALVAALAVSLALLIPLEQAHCAWMGLERHAAAASMPSGHACCAPKPAVPCQSTPAAPDCACMQLPAASLPAAIDSPQLPTTTTIAVLAAVTVVVPVNTLEAPAPALDIGSPPLPIDLGAHGLRAPPRSA